MPEALLSHIYIVLISGVKTCENSTHGHGVTGLERAPRDATGLLTSLTPSKGSGIRAGLC